MDKHEVAQVLEEIGSLLELQAENPFKIQAYRNAARAIENLDEDLAILVEEQRLTEIPGIGEKIAEKITLLILTGHLPYYEELKKSIPSSLFALMRVSGLGGKKIKALHDALGINDLAGLEQACQAGKVAEIPHFGKKTQDNILHAIAHLKHQQSERMLWWDAMEEAQAILGDLKKLKGVQQAEIAGSLRRKLETVGDVDLIVSSETPKPIMEWFAKQPRVEKILAKGPTKSTVNLTSGLQVDLRIVSQEQFPFALFYFTGSKQHEIKIRQRANERGFTLNEYGLESLSPDLNPPVLKKPVTETSIYQALGLGFIPPELREDRGEIEAAAQGKLPQLVEEKDIRGAFHCHTSESDGHNTLEEMAKAAQDLGWDYLGIADHSKSSYQAHGLNEERLMAQLSQIRTLNRSKKFSTHLFAGVECDIMTDGKLDFSDEVLKNLDYVIVSIHRSFQLDEQKMTARLIKAIENPYTTMLGHVTGRLLLQREAYALNIDKVIDACIANKKIMELNAQPKRLDMDWRLWHRAAQKGLKCCINPDAHRAEGLQVVKGGVYMARKGWLEKRDVINTMPLKEVQKYLKKMRSS